MQLFRRPHCRVGACEVTMFAFKVKSLKFALLDIACAADTPSLKLLVLASLMVVGRGLVWGAD